MSEQYEPCFQTERFDVFHHHVVRNPEVGLPRDVYTAWFRDEDVPRPVCVVTINPSPFLGNYVEWVQVCDQYRRQGIATEVLDWLKGAIGELVMDGATEAGEAFVESFCKES